MQSMRKVTRILRRARIAKFRLRLAKTARTFRFKMSLRAWRISFASPKSASTCALRGSDCAIHQPKRYFASVVNTQKPEAGT